MDATFLHVSRELRRTLPASTANHAPAYRSPGPPRAHVARGAARGARGAPRLPARETMLSLLPFALRSLRRRKDAFGREDECEEQDREEKPVVLTDLVCLIPGGEPVVRLEDAPGNARRIFTGIDISASVEEVWDVMTSYELLETLGRQRRHSASCRVPVRDITMQNVLDERSDFVHYQAVWRFQPLTGCAMEGQDMMRLSFSVECQPHWFLPVAPVEGRIAAAMGENMVAIRSFVEGRKKAEEAMKARQDLVSNEEDFERLQDRLYQLVEEQHPEAIRDEAFLAMPFNRLDLQRRWPRLVQTLGVSQEQALEIVETDVTPLLVESDDVAEILSRLAAISSREKALELIGIYPSLLAHDVNSMLREEELELYSHILAGLKPLVQGRLDSEGMQTMRRKLLEASASVAPNDALRILLRRLAEAPDPLAFLIWQTKAGLSVAWLLLQQPSLALSIAHHSPRIIPHLPSIYTRLSVIEPHVPGIVRILDPYFEVVRPHLDRIMERMDERLGPDGVVGGRPVEPDDFLHGWSLESLSPGGGKGGTMMSRIENYLVKELSKGDHRTLLQITKSYCEHMQSGPSLICPIFLHFRDKASKRVFFAMRRLGT
eukprot:g7417.t2